MTALHLHNSLFTGEKEFDQPFHSIEPLLIPASRRFSPISPSFNSPAFQDLIARQPTHPDGPRAGWDLGLNLLGDPPTAAEYKSVEEHSVKNKLRRLHRAAVAFEFVFGLWGVYTVIRYFLAFATVSHHAQRIFSLALGIASAVAVAATIVSVTLPLFYGSTCVHSCRQIRTLLRACYLLLILSVSATNLALVATWRPKDRCAWDIDVSWYLSALNSTTRCEPATFALWIIAAVLRLFLTSLLIVLFMYILRAYSTARHPSQTEIQKRRRSHRPTVSLSDVENVSPTDTFQRSTSSLLMSKPTFSFSPFIRPSHRHLRRSSSTLAPSSSSGTLVSSLPHTGAAQSSSPNNASYVKHPMPPSYRPPVGQFPQQASFFNVNYDSSRRGGDGASVDVYQPEEAMTPTSRMLRRTSRLAPPDSSRSEKISDDKAYLADGTYLPDVSFKEKDAHNDSDADSVSSSDQVCNFGLHPYAYGYGAPGPSYPYLDVYNPRTGPQPSDPSSASVESIQDRCSTTSDVSDYEDDRDEFIPMMGRYVRRMSTIESLGSREVSTLGGTKSLHMSARSRSPSLMIGSVSSCMGGLPPTHRSRFSSLQLSLSSSAPSASIPPSTTESGSGSGKSHSTAYLSLSSGSSNGETGTEAVSGTGTRVRVTERGELIIIPDTSPSASVASSPTSYYGRRYWTASSGQSAQSGQSLPVTMEEGRF